MEPHVALAIDRCERASLVFDIARITRNMRAIAEAARAAAIVPLFAMKSFPRPEVLALAAEYLGGFDAASPAELATSRELSGGILSIVDPGGRAIADAPRDRRVLVGCETLQQVAAAPSHAEIAIRISASITGRDPAIGALLDGTGHRMSRFGIATRHELELLLHAVQDRPIGIHLHHGPVTATSVERFVATARAAIALLHEVGREPAFVNLGGAWHGIDDHARAFAELRAAFPGLELFIEPGRAYAEGAGFAYGRVLSSREAADRVLRVVDLSRACHLRWSQPELVVPPPRAAERRKIVVLGPTCYEEDAIGEWIAEPAHVATRIMLRNITGYAVGWNTGFGGIPPADVVMCG